MSVKTLKFLKTTYIEIKNNDSIKVHFELINEVLILQTR